MPARAICRLPCQVPPKEAPRAGQEDKEKPRQAGGGSLGQLGSRGPSPVARATEGLDPSVGDHASGVPTVGREGNRMPASQRR